MWRALTELSIDLQQMLPVQTHLVYVKILSIVIGKDSGDLEGLRSEFQLPQLQMEEKDFQILELTMTALPIAHQ